VLTGTPHFTLAEVAAHTEWPIPSGYADNAQATLEAAEQLRAVLGGGRLRVTSLWRSVVNNAAQEGSATNSRHLTAQAVDLVPMDISLDEAARRWAAAIAAGGVAPFDQMLIEGNHLHFDPGGLYGYRRQSLVATASGGWISLDSWIGSHPLAVATSGVLGLVLVVLAVLIFGGAPRKGRAPAAVLA